MTLLHQDFPDVRNEDITLAKVQKQFSKWRIGGEYAGQLKVIDSKKGVAHGKISRDGLDETTEGNLDLHDEQSFIPDFCLLRGKLVDFAVGVVLTIRQKPHQSYMAQTIGERLFSLYRRIRRSHWLIVMCQINGQLKWGNEFKIIVPNKFAIKKQYLKRGTTCILI